ncbi:translation initiation factor SUI1 [Melampsora americana]|nr:translation initiation factor SUI1 [Melampsora americana]
MSVQNLTSRDPFADVGDDQAISTKAPTKAPDYVHIRIQQRNGRKTLTTLQGLPSEYDPKKLLKAFKKDFACNGTLVQDEELGQVIQLQGDQRTKVSLLLVDAGIRKFDLVSDRNISDSIHHSSFTLRSSFDDQSQVDYQGN